MQCHNCKIELKENPNFCASCGHKIEKELPATEVNTAKDIMNRNAIVRPKVNEGSSKKEALVLFSGGRDSSAAAVEMIKAGYKISLFTFQAGLPELVGPKGDSAPDIRHAELLRAFPHQLSPERIMTGTTYLIRTLAIERTNDTHVVYPLALALAVHSEAVLHCLRSGTRNIACGYSGYQGKEDRYIEQRQDFFELMSSFLKEYDISYHAPIIESSKDEVIDILEQRGISSNSLENKSIFGAIPFEVDKALDFWDESLPICRKYIKNSHTFNHS